MGKRQRRKAREGSMRKHANESAIAWTKRVIAWLDSLEDFT